MRLQAAAPPRAPALRSRRAAVVAKAQASSDVSRRGILLSAAAAGLMLRPDAGACATFAHAATAALHASPQPRCDADLAHMCPGALAAPTASAYDFSALMYDKEVGGAGPALVVP